MNRDKVANIFFVFHGIHWTRILTNQQPENFFLDDVNQTKYSTMGRVNEHFRFDRVDLVIFICDRVGKAVFELKKSSKYMLA